MKLKLIVYVLEWLARMLYNHIDKNKDGIIQKEEVADTFVEVQNIVTSIQNIKEVIKSNKK